MICNRDPAWANACVAVWQAKLDQEAAEAARIAVEQAQQDHSMANPEVKLDVWLICLAE
jgi:hypothetical protein